MSAQITLDRFLARVDKTDTCWLWTGATNGKGYGRLYADGAHVYAHRYSFETFVGPIPEGMVLCHSCDVRNCVNPAHLWPGTVKDNQQDMSAKGRGRGRFSGATHCAQGHEFTEATTRHLSNGGRRCRTCLQALRATDKPRASERTECPSGHAYDDANTYVHPVTGHRTCRTCRREGERNRKAVA